MAFSVVLWSRSFPLPLPFMCSMHMPHTMAEPHRASSLHHASASHIHSMKSKGNVAEAQPSSHLCLQDNQDCWIVGCLHQL